MDSLSFANLPCFYRHWFGRFVMSRISEDMSAHQGTAMGLLMFQHQDNWRPMRKSPREFIIIIYLYHPRWRPLS
jgi:hypothetical protein